MPWQGVGVGVNSYSITREDPDYGVWCRNPLITFLLYKIQGDMHGLLYL